MTFEEALKVLQHVKPPVEELYDFNKNIKHVNTWRCYAYFQTVKKLSEHVDCSAAIFVATAMNRNIK